MTVDTGKIWNVILMICAVSVVALILVAILSTKKISGYYLGATDGSTSKTCAFVDIQWTLDSRVFCTDDIPFAIESVRQLNDTLK